MTTELFLPADGLSLLGEDEGGDYAGRRFLVGRGDGQVIQLPLLLYLIMAAIAEGGVDGGWSADQVGARVGAASGQRMAADNVRYLVTGKLAPLGLVAGGAADDAAGPAQPSRVSPRPEPGIRGALPRPRLAAGRVARLLPRHHGRRWALAAGAAAVLVSAAAVPPMMTGSGNQAAGGSAASWPQAAAWVAQQVSPDVDVSCDPGMCGQLRRDGFPSARLRPLPPGARGLPRSAVIVATPAIRSQLGPGLATADAPQVIASFGSGAARVDIRTVAPGGAAAFEAQLAAGQAALAAAGRQLLGNQNIQAAPAARAALRAGRVDARLLALLPLLAAQLPVRLAGFTGAPGAGPDAPLRGAEIGAASVAARSAIVALLNAQQSPYRPADVAVAVAGGSRPLVTLRFDAPAALNISPT